MKDVCLYGECRRKAASVYVDVFSIRWRVCNKHLQQLRDEDRSVRSRHSEAQVQLAV